MDVINLFAEREDLSRSLSDSYKHLWQKGQEYAQAEHDYKIANKIEMFRLHEEQKVAWTVCQSLAHGDDKVAELRLKRDLADMQYDVMKSKMQGIKLQLTLIEAELSRSWSTAKEH
jgi:hypothetical protein